MTTDSVPRTWPPSLHELFTSQWGFGVSQPSPLQEGILHAADGRSIEGVLTPEACEAHFGCEPDALGVEKPDLVVGVAGVRSGKTMLAAAAGVSMSQTADLSQLMPHEIARVPIVAPTVDNATATFRMLVGPLLSSPVLRELVVGEPTADTVMLHRPDGRVVEIVVTAAHRGGITLRSRWLAGAILDEVALFGTDASGAVVNAEELLRAAEGRVVRGGQVWVISSPFGPQGLLHDLFQQHFGKPGRVLVFHAPTLAMNPAFDPEKVATVRARDPDAAAREYDAAWIDADTAFFDGKTVDAAVRKSPLELPPEGRCHAAWDVGTRANAWTLVVTRGERAGQRTRVRTMLARQWIGSRREPLDPEVVISEASADLARYGVRRVHSDAWSFDALRPLARAKGIELHEVTTEERNESFATMKTMLGTGELELAPVPALVTDLKAVRKKATVNAVRIDLPRTADGRHCDYAPALALAVRAALRAPNDTTPRARRTPAEGSGYAMQRMLADEAASGGPEFEVADGGVRVRRGTRTGARNRYTFGRGGF